MNPKSIYFSLTFIVIPAYLFYAPIKDYLQNFNKLTYSLEIPENEILKDKKSIHSHQSISLDDDFLLEKKISEAWVLIFPNVDNNDLKTIFKQELEDIGITSMVDLKSKKQIIVGVGPFVDKKMAEMIALKIIKSTGKKGEIKRLGN